MKKMPRVTEDEQSQTQDALKISARNSYCRMKGVGDLDISLWHNILAVKCLQLALPQTALDHLRFGCGLVRISKNIPLCSRTSYNTSQWHSTYLNVGIGAILSAVGRTSFLRGMVYNFGSVLSEKSSSQDRGFIKISVQEGQ